MVIAVHRAILVVLIRVLVSLLSVICDYFPGPLEFGVEISNYCLKSISDESLLSLNFSNVCQMQSYCFTDDRFYSALWKFELMLMVRFGIHLRPV